MTQVATPAKLQPTIRASAITVDGVSVQVVAEGPGIGWLERKLTERNAKRWKAGLRPNRYGLWR